MKNLSITLKLWAVLAFFLGLFIITWAFTYHTSVKISEYLDSSKVEVMKQSDRLRQALRDVEQLVNDAAQLRDEDIVGEADKKAEEVRDALKALRGLDPSQRDEYEKAQIDFELYFNSARAAAMIIIREDTFNEEILMHAGQVRKILPGLRERVDNILNRSYSAFTNLLNQATTTATALVRNNSMILFLVIAVSAIWGPFIIRTVTKPIARLVRATNELASGNLDAKAEISARDEIGALAMAFNEMTAALKEKSQALEKTTKELKIANKELKEADRLKTEFLSTMSHELRTPLNAIINFSDIILEDWDQLGESKEWSDEANDMLRRVYKNSTHLLSLINDLLDLAKIESGYMELKIESVDVQTLIAEAVASVTSLAKAKNLELSHSAQEDLPDLMGDERKLFQVLINLLSNAIKFTENGSVTVTAQMTDVLPDGVVIKVTDSGMGIPGDAQSAIFDRFRQVDGADSRNFPGTGLGLNLVKELTELHGGHVMVESREGEGSVFAVYLPFKPPPASVRKRGGA